MCEWELILGMCVCCREQQINNIFWEILHLNFSQRANIWFRLSFENESEWRTVRDGEGLLRFGTRSVH